MCEIFFVCILFSLAALLRFPPYLFPNLSASVLPWSFAHWDFCNFFRFLIPVFFLYIFHSFIFFTKQNHNCSTQILIKNKKLILRLSRRDLESCKFREAKIQFDEGNKKTHHDCQTQEPGCQTPELGCQAHELGCQTQVPGCQTHEAPPGFPFTLVRKRQNPDLTV